MSLLAMQSPHAARLALGTVQLGMRYGIANRSGQPGEAEAEEILKTAYDQGVRLLDTAQSYGTSEKIIGRFHARHPGRRFAVISKLRPGLDWKDSDQVRRVTESSARELGGPLAALLLHDPALLRYWDVGPGPIIGECIGRGLVELAGVSVYSPQDFKLAIEIPDIRVIQAPFNALDRRLLVSGLLKRARQAGKIVLLRSVYLQGLLTLDPAALPARLAFARETLTVWRAVCDRHRVEPVVAAMKYAQQAGAGCWLVVGCEQAEQVARNLGIGLLPPLPDALISDIESLPVPEERIINPSLWPRE